MPRRQRPTNEQRAWQREFRDWLAANRHRFATGRAIRARLTVRHVQIRIEGLNPLLGIRVQPRNIGVDITWQGRWFDRLFDLDLHEVRTAGGRHGCAECMDFMAANALGPAPLYPSLHVLRIQHQYEALLDWCNTDLFPARRIRMVNTDGGSTGACLVMAGESPVAPRQGHRCFHVPVWVDDSTSSKTWALRHMSSHPSRT